MKRICNLPGCTKPPSTLVAPYIHRGYCSSEHKALGENLHRACAHGIDLKDCGPCLLPEYLRYRKALARIASEDYRGNRPQSAVIAYFALHPEEKI
jgi:hypothetical protein